MSREAFRHLVRLSCDSCAIGNKATLRQFRFRQISGSAPVSIHLPTEVNQSVFARLRVPLSHTKHRFCRSTYRRIHDSALGYNLMLLGLFCPASHESRRPRRKTWQYRTNILFVILVVGEHRSNNRLASSPQCDLKAYDPVGEYFETRRFRPSLAGCPPPSSCNGRKSSGMLKWASFLTLMVQLHTMYAKYSRRASRSCKI
ncbi:hypothetical protein B0H13DRAFT_64720 [Mycena leptocephala]|nr:hypothetical protein B0H13DRAFT_64720 [Mycena leptocephala]